MSAPIYSGGQPFFKGGIRTKLKVVASASAAVTLTKSQSNSTFAFDRAGGTSYTLPAAVPGLVYTFYVTVLQTGGANVVVTSAATVFLTGAVIAFSGEAVTPSSTLGPFMFAGNGTSHLRTTTNATTTGGGIGTWMEYVCISSTLWFVTGVVKSPSGNLATPFSV